MMINDSKENKYCLIDNIRQTDKSIATKEFDKYSK